MVLDPLSALGIAGNVVQFVDFALNLVSETRIIYNSATGSTKEHLLLSAIADDIQKLSADLEFPQSGRGDASVSNLREIAEQAQEIAKDLLDAVSSLRASKPGSKWASFKAALKHVRRDDKIQGLVSHITKLQTLLTNRILYALKQKQCDIYKKLEDIERTTKKLGMTKTDEISSLRKEISEMVDKLGAKSNLATNTVQVVLAKVQQDIEVSPKDISLLSQRMNELAVSLKKLPVECGSVCYDQSILQSLHFEQLGFRYQDVPEAHEKTFKWVFEKKLPDIDRELGFINWLKSESGIYWVMGKPGSGKSTLMKYLRRHERVSQELKVWAGKTKLVCADFFFWTSGSNLQKSQEGLLRGLLFEVLRQCPSFIQRLWPPDASGFDSHTNEYTPRDWSRAKILSSIKSLVEFDNVPVRFCFFIDGLDEYESAAAQEGDHSELVKVLETLATSPDIKLCVSSRPWYVFKDAFGSNPKRFLKLEDLTRADIKGYVHSKLEESARYRQLESEDPAYAELENEVVERAQGVFLWVYLVVQSLLRGITQADRISTLQKRLRAIPSRLDEYFQQMLDSVEDIYRPDTARMFQTCQRALAPLSLMTFWYIDEDRNLNIHAEFKPVPNKEAKRRLDDMRRRLDGCTKGLIEVKERPSVSAKKNGMYLAYGVDFLHRTAKDFVASREVQRMLRPYMPRNFEPHMRIAKALLVSLKSLPARSKKEGSDGSFDSLLAGLMEYCVLMDREQDPPFNREELIEILSIAERLSFNRPRNEMYMKQTAFVGLLVHHGHIRYLRWRLRQQDKLNLIQQRHWHHCFDRPLIDYACDFSRPKFFSQGIPNGTTRLEIVSVLMAAGESYQMVFNEQTVLQRFLQQAKEGVNERDRKDVLEITKLFVRRGAKIKTTAKAGQGCDEDILRAALGEVEGSDALFKMIKRRGVPAPPPPGCTIL